MTNTLIFIDARISGYQKLLDGMPQGAEVVLLSPSEDGLAQITSALAGRSNLDAIHLISHGSEGALYLGGSVLNSTTLAGYTAQLQQLGQALAPSGDLLLYGCDVASGDAGMDFITRLSVITGADVAASTDLTGAAALGGDAVLEVATGSIEASGVLTVEILVQLDTLLAAPVLGNPVAATPTYTENGAPVVIAPNLTVADIDSPAVVSATVRITNALRGDVLAANVSDTPIAQS